MDERTLTVDVGNSLIKLGLFESDRLIQSDSFPTTAQQALLIPAKVMEWRRDAPFDRVILSSVVPYTGDLLVSHLERALEQPALVVNDFKTRIMPLLVDHPDTVGVDRVVNCFGAMCLFGTPLLVISMGTATTFEVVTEAGEYAGGAIAPGVRISIEALTKRTALLPPGVWDQPDSIIAKNTIGHMKAGIYYGTVSMIEGMIKRYKQAAERDLGVRDLKVIGTGGVSEMIQAEGLFDVHEPGLTLKGLYHIGQWEKTL